MRLWKKPPDLSLSNEYQELTRGGCINCGALREVLKSATGWNYSQLRDIIGYMPSVNDSQEGCWAYEWREGQPDCLGKLKDEDPKIIQARNKIIAARQAIADAEVRHHNDRAREFRRLSKRRLP